MYLNNLRHAIIQTVWKKKNVTKSTLVFLSKVEEPYAYNDDKTLSSCKRIVKKNPKLPYLDKINYDGAALKLNLIKWF